jgi:hypothetical protein
MEEGKAESENEKKLIRVEKFDEKGGGMAKKGDWPTNTKMCK